MNRCCLSGEGPRWQRSEGTLTLEHYELIRRKVLVEGLGQRATAMDLGHSRKTVAKASAYRIPRGIGYSDFPCSSVKSEI